MHHLKSNAVTDKHVKVKYTLSYKKKVYKKITLKWSKSQENLKKITRLNFQNEVFLMAKNRYFVIIAFKMLKMQFKFKCAMLVANV